MILPSSFRFARVTPKLQKLAVPSPIHVLYMSAIKVETSSIGITKACNLAKSRGVPKEVALRSSLVMATKKNFIDDCVEMLILLDRVKSYLSSGQTYDTILLTRTVEKIENICKTHKIDHADEVITSLRRFCRR